MRSLKRGKGTSASVENITPFGIWLFVKEKEYFLSYKDYPYFKDQTLNAIQNVQLTHGVHLYWPELDVDLEIDNLENPDKYPLKFKGKKPSAKLEMLAKEALADYKTGRVKDL
jgi:hypothetical protein